MRAHCLALLVALAPGLVAADPFKPGIQDQIKLGQRGAEQVRQEEKVLPDSDPRVKEIREIGAKIVALIPADERKKHPFKYSFDVVDSKEVNAFALPGGPIFFYTGLMDRFSTEDQLAGVLAHEIVHVRNQHWASAYADNMKRRLGISALLFLLGAGDTAFDIAGVADTLLFTLPYSRKHETESDDQGYELMVRAGYNPEGFAQSFETLKRAGGGGGVEWMNTHPDLDRRITRIRDRVKKDTRRFPAQRTRDKSVAWLRYRGWMGAWPAP